MSKPIKSYKGKPHANKLCRPQAYAWVALHVEDAFATVVDEADGAVETNFSRIHAATNATDHKFAILIGLGDKAQFIADRLRFPC